MMCAAAAKEYRTLDPPWCGSTASRWFPTFRAYYSGKHKAHDVNVQVIADPARSVRISELTSTPDQAWLAATAIAFTGLAFCVCPRRQSGQSSWCSGIPTDRP